MILSFAFDNITQKSTSSKLSQKIFQPYASRVTKASVPELNSLTRYHARAQEPICLEKAPETFKERKAIFNSSVSKNGEAYTPETSCMKRSFVYIKNMCIQDCNRKVREFAMA